MRGEWEWDSIVTEGFKLFHGVTPTDNSRKVCHFRCHLRLSDMSSIEHWGIRISYCRLRLPSQRRNLSRGSEIPSQKI